MKSLIAIVFLAAAAGVILSYSGLISATHIIPPVLFASALILVLLQMINIEDRRY